MNTQNDYIAIGTKMAQALQDVIDETCAAENCCDDVDPDALPIASQQELEAAGQMSEAKSDESELNALLYSVEENLMKRMYFALDTARDNAIELYNSHMIEVDGKPTTKKNEYIAKLLKDDMDEVTDLIKGLTYKYGEFGI